MKVPTNITLGPELKKRAKAYAENIEMDLSELVGYLLRAELANPTLPPPEQIYGRKESK